MEDINLLRYFMEAKQFRSTRTAIPEGMFSADVINMLAWFAAYYKKYPKDTHINVDNLSMMMKLSSMDKVSYDVHQSIFHNLRIPIDPIVQGNIMEMLEERRLEGEVGLILERYRTGEEIDITHEIMVKTQESMKRRKVKHRGEWEDGDVWAMVQADADTSGYLFTFLPRSFHMKLKGCNGGDNICVAAPTNKGKSSFLINVAIDFAKQFKALYDDYLKQVAEGQYDGEPMHFRPVLYLINEGNAKRLTPRAYQTALGINRSQMFELGAKGQLEAKYCEVLGRRDAIRFVNIHGLSVGDVSKIIEAHDPFLVVTDMTGRIKADYKSTGMNTVDQLEHVWNTMRELATIYDFIHVGTVQISKEGFDMLYPTIDAVQNSKTGIQTTWDLAIFIGAMLQPAVGAEGQRGISTPKSKLARQGHDDYIMEPTNFNPELNTWKLPEE